MCCVWVKIMAQSYPSRLLRRKKQKFTPDVEENPRDLTVTVKYRHPWDVAVVTDSVVLIVAAN